MRKTKAASSAAPAASKKRATAKRTRAVAKPRPGTPETRRAGVRQERRIAAADAYQAGPRVWPD
jgi:hypothetical protein